MQAERFAGIILFTRKHREKDMLVKIFTREYGKRMFFLRNIQRPKNPLRAAAFAFVRGHFIGQINASGLSFLNDVQDSHFPRLTTEDISVNAYASYMTGLLDAALEDGELNPILFDLLWQALSQVEAGKDPAVVANIFELQLLPQFGVMPNLKACVFCGQADTALDYSMKYAGFLCQRHFDKDPRRLHWSPRTAYLIQHLSQVDLSRLGSVQLKPANKQALRAAIDELYEEYVGIHLKSRSFIDQLEKMINPLDGNK
ncbi:MULTISPECIES: DNA repair protein RecO [Aerococcus]|uniref:DNA repair protein RecO n=1 Tax=Aerococcus sanguinicola TaxID=119206 RepID=A0A5N1GN80_9LACT|nr:MULTISPECIES: DNA repair protein RecO [Aerococcus]KAA9301854.1 DNA repair protein RecO [Aerococcus sanguinicola]MDK6368724.1 DNA repair protein RecO [Aerococcus sp. UMB9870]MDK6679272.1 DNA repair protein RecO [Aerococcus sp. UMB8608]MDK6685886.1 DNA repair protein RecO [Aerococcus sp. UMB8623]MDK6939347.1 DNA repair protein RecO [Aerococcus sp. UMB8487]